MKKMVIKLKLFIVIVMITIPTIIIAQTDGDGTDDPQNDAELPFDGGVSLLVAAGIGYGLKKVYDNKKAGEYNSNH